LRGAGCRAQGFSKEPAEKNLTAAGAKVNIFSKYENIFPKKDEKYHEWLSVRGEKLNPVLLLKILKVVE
jgi:hypothetical protein